VDEPKEIILVTGSSGFIGSAVVRRLARDHTVVGFDREGDPHPPMEAECVCVDVTDEESVRAGLARLRYAHGERIASVIHLAAYYDFSGEPSPLYEQITVRGTERLLGGLQEFQVEQFVFSSTMLVHAPSRPGKPIGERSPLAPEWDYPRSKIDTERVVGAERGDIPAVLLRIAGVYDDGCHSIPIAHQIQRIYERELTSHFFPGDPTRGRQSFVHLDDLVAALDKVVRRRAELPPELPLLVGEPEAMSYAELQHELGCLIHGDEWTTREVPEPLAKAGAWVQEKLPGGRERFIKPWMVELADDDYELDITRGRETLGWEPKRSLREALPKMVAALKADPPGWYRENKLEPPTWLVPAGRAAAEGGTDGDEPADRKQTTPEPVQERRGGRRAGEPDDRGAIRHGESHPEQHRERRTGEPGEASAEMVSEHGAMPDEHHDPAETIRRMRAPWLWTNFLNIALGVWLMTSPLTFGYLDPELAGSDLLRVTGERGLSSITARGAAMAWSDLISGALIVLLAALALIPKPRTDFFGRWGVGLVGVWLQFAPLVLWAPTPAAFVNDTLIGALVITFAVLVPMMPGMAHHMVMMKPGPETPPGWTYNPSSWLQRGPVIALGLLGWFISRYLAAYQLGYIGSAWDPMFGAGTREILDSEVSRAWPISDAGLGAVAYTFEALMGVMGGTSRWRTMPWMVTFFGILVIPLGAVSIFLVIMQPVAVGIWCTLCLVTAVAMLIMIPLTMDEVVAMGQFLVRSHHEGRPFWRTFWAGGTFEEEANEDTRTASYGAPVRQWAPSMVWGVTVPWTLLVSALLGVWLMAAPDVFGTEGPAADSDHLVGAVVATVAVISMAEVVRAGRFLNGLFGLWIIAAPWLLSGATQAATWSNVIVGALVVLLSIPRGSICEQYGGWDRLIF
jgi:nucleoside-diphosphate-sugar epimerase